jgi:hypothetical protein
MGVATIFEKSAFYRVLRQPRDAWRDWSEQDVISLNQRLYDPTAYSGGAIKITRREYRALPELNRRVMSNMKGALLYPFLAWVEGRGLYPLRKTG